MTSVSLQYNYKHNHLLEKGKHIGVKSVLDDPCLMHCKQAGRLASDQEYRKDALTTSGKYHLTTDMINLVTAKNAQALASEQDYRKRLHKYTVLPDDMKVKWAKTAYNLQSEVRGVDEDGMREREGKGHYANVSTWLTHFIALCLETLQVRPQLHERSGLGRCGCTSDGVG